MTPAEFTSIAKALRPRLLALGRSFFGNEEAAEDAVQEAMMKLWKAWEPVPTRTDAERGKCGANVKKSLFRSLSLTFRKESLFIRAEIVTFAHEIT